MKKPKVGQILFLMPQGNQARQSQEIKQAEVVSVGNKYFKAKISNYYEPKFYIENWREATEYTPNWYAFESEQEIIELQQSEILCPKIRAAFGYGNKYTLAQLKQVAEIINLQN